jgi:metal-responsive CopG/Arc/MetJ family transcriptional regulator
MRKLPDIPPGKAARLKTLLNSRSKKAKTSVTISEDLLAAADELAGKSHRSELIEDAVRAHLRRHVKRARHERELAILNRHADALNAEAAETLEYQTDLDDE